jgi:hypothetical protein
MNRTEVVEALRRAVHLNKVAASHHYKLWAGTGMEKGTVYRKYEADAEILRILADRIEQGVIENEWRASLFIIDWSDDGPKGGEG